MDFNLRIRQVNFDEEGLNVLIHRLENDECFQSPVYELFYNDKILAGLKFDDVRLICHFAAMEEQKSDQSFIKKIKRRSVVKPLRGFADNSALKTRRPLSRAGRRR
jgi:hypothetical protein